ncbi:hypothetical protein HID58_002319 [Brassica napus]|uniref:Uncharacterized protein n=1 Tax=Brassica napus TaxID=3708 RepID=A0ABQ8EMZ6_BRANA|nr:hypothetical protein HID58_002319 [Brassica napus]
MWNEEPRVQLPSERTGVFARVQVSQGQAFELGSKIGRLMSYTLDRLGFQEHARTETDIRGHRGLNNSKHDSHSDRVIRARDERPRSNRYGGFRFGNKPYDRFGMDELTWRAKEKEKVSGGSGSMAVVPYEHKLHNKPLLITEDKASRNESTTARYWRVLLSPPSRQPPSMEDNITVRCNLNRSLTFSPQGSTNVTENDQMIGALNDIDLDLMDLEDKGQSSEMAESSRAKAKWFKSESSFGHSNKENGVLSPGFSTHEIN